MLHPLLSRYAYHTPSGQALSLDGDLQSVRPSAFSVQYGGLSTTVTLDSSTGLIDAGMNE